MDAQHVSNEVRSAVDAAMQDLVLLGEHMRDSAGPTVVSIAQKLLRVKFLADEIGGAP